MPRHLTARAWLSSQAKRPADSKGFLGSLLATGSLGLLALFLTRATGFEIQADELRDIGDHTRLLIAQGAAWVGFGSALLGLWGNWSRQFRIAWDGQTGKTPWKSRGILGNLGAALAALVAFLQAIALDAQTLLALYDDIRAQWQLTAPPAVALITALQGLWGRYRAARTLRAVPIDPADLEPQDPQTGGDFPFHYPPGHSRSAILIPLCIALAGLTQASCQTIDDAGRTLSDIRVQVGVVGAGAAVEITGPEGRGIGAALSFYPVTPQFHRLKVEW